MSKILYHIIYFIIRDIPGSPGRKIRYLFYKNKFAKCGKNVNIDTGVIITNPEQIYIGDNVWIDHFVILLTGKINDEGIIVTRKPNPDYTFEEGQLHIGDNVHIAPFVVLQAHGGLSIGMNVGIASGVKIYSLSNHYKNLNDKNDSAAYYFTPLAPKNHQSYVLSPVCIQNGTAVGLNSTILPGTTVPNGTWIGVNTFLQGRNLQEDSIYAGESAKFVKRK